MAGGSFEAVELKKFHADIKNLYDATGLYPDINGSQNIVLMSSSGDAA